MTTIPESAEAAEPEEGVSAGTAKRLREAMDRLMAGRPQLTDGRLIKDNLWKEANVSRATMNRATQIMSEWDARVAACEGFTPGEARKNDEITTLRAALADKTRECTQLSHRLDAAATAPPCITTTHCYAKNSTTAVNSSPSTLTAPRTDADSFSQ